MNTAVQGGCSVCFGNGYTMTGQPCGCGALQRRLLSVPNLQSEIEKLRTENASLQARVTAFSDLTGLMQKSLEEDTARISELLEENAALAEQNGKMREALEETGACLDEDDGLSTIISKALALPDLSTPAINQSEAGFVAEINNLKEQVEELQQSKFKRFREDECWIYQGDGEDHLESLVCPVVVTVAQIKQIKAEALREAAIKLERINNDYACEVGYLEPDTNAYVCNDEFAMERMEAFDDAIASLRAKADELEGKR